MEPKFSFKEVPPPARAPVHQIAETLGLCAGLRVERAEGSFRCACCHLFEAPYEWMVWVPDSVRQGDHIAVVVEKARLNAFNGQESAWCIKCALSFKEGKLPEKKTEETVTQLKKPWYRFW